LAGNDHDSSPRPWKGSARDDIGSWILVEALAERAKLRQLQKGGKSMALEDITWALFAICSSLRIFAYVPQIRAAAIDTNGATAISYTTWGLFFLTNVATVAYALVNRQDLWLAACFIGNAVCCLFILGITFWKRRRMRRVGYAGHGRAR
jgi:hypothetical protein